MKSASFYKFMQESGMNFFLPFILIGSLTACDEAPLTADDEGSEFFQVQTIPSQRVIPGRLTGQLLWNKLGSELEVLTSETGVDGMINDMLNFSPVQHGNGVALANGISQVKFGRPFRNAFPDAGTIEFWWIPGRDENSSTGSHFDERLAISLTSDATRANGFPELSIRLMEHSGNYQNRTRVSFQIGEEDRVIVEYDQDFNAGELMHIAVTWDKSLGSAPVKTFFDGVEGIIVEDFSINPEKVIDDIQAKIKDPAYAYDLELHRRSKRPDGAANQFDPDAFIDNLKIYGCAKATFRDRFEENAAKGCPLARNR